MDIDTHYRAALDYLYSFIEYSLTHQEILAPEKYDLSRIKKLLSLLGEPEKKYPSIHVAGSKGKGSVCSLCASAMVAAGYRVGLYTSPHLKDFEERIQVNGEPISRSELVDLVDEIKPYVDALPWLTTFEITTALGFWYFARQGVDIAVIEVGLGGRLDATNVITPEVSVITALYLEHTSILGDTLPQIATEKAGIIKPGVPIVLSPQKDVALEVVRKIAAERHAPLTYVGVDYQYKREKATLDGESFAIWPSNNPGEEPIHLEIPFLGEHQVDNAATAYVALQALRDRGYTLREIDIQEGFARAIWPARFEIIRENPPVVIDSAHTPDAIGKILKTLDEFFAEMPVVLVFGVSEDKRIHGMLELLAARVKHIICTQSTHPRAMEADALKELALVYDRPVESIDSAGDALERALEIAGKDSVVLVTGSIFVGATARIAWKERLQYEWSVVNNA
jgi:dihydrofolate synthase/folylpolyglutamate synthase